MDWTSLINATLEREQRPLSLKQLFAIITSESEGEDPRNYASLRVIVCNLVKSGRLGKVKIGRLPNFYYKLLWHVEGQKINNRVFDTLKKSFVDAHS